MMTFEQRSVLICLVALFALGLLARPFYTRAPILVDKEQLHRFNKRVQSLESRSRHSSKYPCWVDVSITGAVAYPGSYRMQYGSRLYDLLKQAGAKQSTLDKQGQVSKRVLQHDQVIHIP